MKHHFTISFFIDTTEKNLLMHLRKRQCERYDIKLTNNEKYENTTPALPSALQCECQQVGY